MRKQDYPEIIKKMNRKLRKNTCNNYRKLHGLPMHRWKQENKVIN